MSYVHEVRDASCWIVTVFPATVAVPVLTLPAFGPIARMTEPDPVLPPLAAIQPTLLLAVHAHPSCAVTLMIACSPDGLAMTRSGDTV